MYKIPRRAPIVNAFFPPFRFFAIVHPKIRIEKPPPVPSTGGGVGAGVGPHPVRKEIKEMKKLSYLLAPIAIT